MSLAEKGLLLPELGTSSLQSHIPRNNKVFFLEQLDIYTSLADPSKKCSFCNKTTREILEDFDIILPKNDLEINVSKEVERILSLSLVPMTTHVLEVKEMAVIKLLEIESGMDISCSEMAFYVERKLQRAFNDKFICNGCMSEHVSKCIPSIIQ